MMYNMYNIVWLQTNIDLNYLSRILSIRLYNNTIWFCDCYFDWLLFTMFTPLGRCKLECPIRDTIESTEVSINNALLSENIK